MCGIPVSLLSKLIVTCEPAGTIIVWASKAKFWATRSIGVPVVGLGVPVGVGVPVGLGVPVGVIVPVGVGDTVVVGVTVAVAVGVGVEVAVAVGVGMAVAVGVGDAPPSGKTVKLANMTTGGFNGV